MINIKDYKYCPILCVRPAEAEALAPVLEKAATPLVTSSTVQTEKTEEVSSAQKSEVRQQNLLTRNRGRFGTVTTSFRGLLSAVSGSGQTKTLLGE